MTCADIAEPARHVLHGVTDHDTQDESRRPAGTPEQPSLPLRTRPPELTMYALARKWAARNPGAVRILRHRELDRLFSAAATRPFTLRALDPFLKYQRQSVGFVWSFLTHRDPQHRHVHGEPTIEAVRERPRQLARTTLHSP